MYVLDKQFTLVIYYVDGMEGNDGIAFIARGVKCRHFSCLDAKREGRGMEGSELEVVISLHVPCIPFRHWKDFDGKHINLPFSFFPEVF